jgi:1,4-dihydroxy-2-naphthoyl-CoA hydrolase
MNVPTQADASAPDAASVGDNGTDTDTDTDGGTGSATTGAPSATAGSLEAASQFVRSAGLLIDEVSSHRVLGHIDLDDGHHTPWGIVHGGVYATAIESAASVGASAAVQDRGLMAVGLTNTTQFLRSLASGRVMVEALALNQGRTQQLWKVDITDESGRLVAHGELRLQNLDPTDR